MQRTIQSPAFFQGIFLLGIWMLVRPCSARAADGPAVTRSGRAVEIRARLIIDNDFGGDPDGLFALAHHLLSPSMDIRGIIGSQNYRGGFYGSPGSPAYACEVVTNLLKSMHLDGSVPIYQGAGSPLKDSKTPVPNEGSRLIIREAMRQDSRIPLYVACGAGLTDIASAYLIEPRIAKRIRLIWIGGGEYPGMINPPPGPSRKEYNLGIDVTAAQVIFNVSDIPIWQVPRNAYRQALVSYSALQAKIGDKGELGHFLMTTVDNLRQMARGTRGETYVLGDSPLVLLTALQSPWEPDPSSSQYVSMPAPDINDSGAYQPNPSGRPIRVYTNLDVRLMFEDFYAKMANFSSSGKEGRSE